MYSSYILKININLYIESHKLLYKIYCIFYIQFYWGRLLVEQQFYKATSLIIITKFSKIFSFTFDIRFIFFFFKFSNITMGRIYINFLTYFFLRIWDQSKKISLQLYSQAPKNRTQNLFTLISIYINL